MELSEKDIARSSEKSPRDCNPSTADSESTLSQHSPSIDEPISSDNIPPLQEKSGPAAYETPPDGGLEAWLQVAGSFFLFFNSWYVVILKGFRGLVALKAEPSSVSTGWKLVSCSESQ